MLIGGGAKSPGFRQRCADLLYDNILLPESDETVATGAAVQAAIITETADTIDIARRWNLGNFIDVSPSVDARERVDIFASHLNQVLANNP